MQADNSIQALNCWPKLVGSLVLYEVPELFDRIEFRAVWRQCHNVDALRIISWEASLG